MEEKELKIILEKHRSWLADSEDGERANLRGADLREADLRGANLSWANLIKADLKEADLRGANLRGANLREANLRGADLREADLRWADLRGADLSDAILREADLRWADLRGADLREADLRWADLRGANIDYSCLPLWCGSLEAHFDDRQLKQIAYHLVKAGLHSRNASEETKAELSKLIDFANGFHRVDECGRIEQVKGVNVMSELSAMPPYELNSFARWLAYATEAYFENPDVQRRFKEWEKEHKSNENEDEK